MPAPPRRTADRHDQPREPGLPPGRGLREPHLLPAAGPVPREAGSRPGASGSVWSDTVVQSKQAPPANKTGAEPGWGTKDRVPSASRGKARWRGLSSSPVQPHRVLGEPHQVKADTGPAGARQLQSPSPARSTACPPPPHQWGPRAPGGKVTSPRRPERGRGQTRHSKGKGRAVAGWMAVLEAVPAPGAKSLGTLTAHNQNQPKHRPEHGHHTVNRSGAAVPGFWGQTGPDANSASAPGARGQPL